MGWIHRAHRRSHIALVIVPHQAKQTDGIVQHVSGGRVDYSAGDWHPQEGSTVRGDIGVLSFNPLTGGNKAQITVRLPSTCR